MSLKRMPSCIARVEALILVKAKIGHLWVAKFIDKPSKNHETDHEYS
ncbi:MAG: hypothetical protein LCH91_01845 [Bacteroidetes bacterium]|nr:hypothetical protein [Bacteroidota bacterium]